MPLTLDNFFKPKQTGPPAPPSQTPNVQISNTDSKKRPLESSTPTEPEQISKPKKVRFEEDDEQGFIDFFLSTAKHPHARGKEVQSRRVAVFGKKYYWGDEVTHKEDTIPASFSSWCVKNGYTDYNSVLVNVYDKKESYIGWHCDDTDELAKGEVISVSFAANRKHRKHELASFEFRWPSKEDPSKKTVKKESLMHGTVIRFDAVKHKKKQCEHRVAKTAFPRVNVTLRKLKN